MQPNGIRFSVAMQDAAAHDRLPATARPVMI
jgi:hypothetical protein